MFLEDMKQIITKAGQIQIATKKKEKTLKKSRITKEPFVGIITSSSIVSAFIGLIYEEEVNNRREVNELPRDFVPEKPRGKHWYEHPYYLESDKEPGKFYLRTYYSEIIEPKKYYLNGEPVLKEAIKDVLPAPSPPMDINDRTITDIVSVEYLDETPF